MVSHTTLPAVFSDHVYRSSDSTTLQPANMLASEVALLTLRFSGAIVCSARQSANARANEVTPVVSNVDRSISVRLRQPSYIEAIDPLSGAVMSAGWSRSASM